MTRWAGDDTAECLLLAAYVQVDRRALCTRRVRGVVARGGALIDREDCTNSERRLRSTSTALTPRCTTSTRDSHAHNTQSTHTTAAVQLSNPAARPHDFHYYNYQHGASEFSSSSSNQHTGHSDTGDRNIERSTATATELPNVSRSVSGFTCGIVYGMASSSIW